MKGKKRLAIVLKSKGICLEGPLKKNAAVLLTKSYHICVPDGSIFCPSLRTLSLEPSAELCQKTQRPSMGVGRICQETATDGSTH